MQLPGFIAYTMNNLSRLILNRTLFASSPFPHCRRKLTEVRGEIYINRNGSSGPFLDPQKADHEISTNTRLLMKRLVVLKMTAAPFKSQL